MNVTLSFSNGRRDFLGCDAFYPHPMNDKEYCIVYGDHVSSYKFVESFYVSD